MSFIHKKCFTMFFVMLLAYQVLALSVVPASAALNTRIVFTPTEIENHFPKSIKFFTHVLSDEEIRSAKFYYYELNATSTTQIPIPIQPSGETDLTYVRDTSKEIAVPATPIYFYWEVTLASGEIVKSERELVSYDDIRFHWQVREKDKISVWWHDRPASFGEQVFDVAVQAMEKQRKLFGTDLAFPIKLIIYNTADEFAAWHNTPTTFIGGEAIPSLGITTEIVEDTDWQTEWLMDVVPHEISHLYFYQVTYHPLILVPSWLNEGLAQFNEFGDKKEVLSSVKAEIQNGQYIPLWGLTGGFDENDEHKFGQSYDESLSAVTFLIETYRENRLSLLLASYKKGNNTEKAFPLALGITFDKFEQDWLAWLGAPEDTYRASPQQSVPSMSDYLTQVVQKATTTTLPVTPTSRPFTTPTPEITSTIKKTASLPSLWFGAVILGSLCLLSVSVVLGSIIALRKYKAAQKSS